MEYINYETLLVILLGVGLVAGTLGKWACEERAKILEENKELVKQNQSLRRILDEYYSIQSHVTGLINTLSRGEAMSLDKHSLLIKAKNYLCALGKKTDA